MKNTSYHTRLVATCSVGIRAAGLDEQETNNRRTNNSNGSDHQNDD